MQPIENEFGEEVVGGRHPSGIRVHVIQKPGFSRVSGILTARFGSIDHRLADGTLLPAGVAHFLEHQMFESEAGDVAERFARLGASSNAFTSFATTSYLFETSSNVEDCVDLLLELVFEPHFTKEGVEKERGVIAQEIRMIEDDPGSRLFHDLLASLYPKHPLATPIAGSLDSIATIDGEVLHSCHRAFYSPPSLSLAIAGAVDPDRIRSAIDRRLANPSRHAANQAPERARMECDLLRTQSIARMDVARAKWLLGIKDEFVAADSHELLRHELAFGVMLELLLSPASDTHAELLAEGLIDDSFGYDATIESEFGFLALGADLERTPSEGDGIALEQRILDSVDRAVATGFAVADFERAKKKRMGRMLHFFDSVEGVAQAFANLAIEGLTPFHWFDALGRLTLDEVQSTAATFWGDTASRRARALVLPLASR